jgi:hypothetical protein
LKPPKTSPAANVPRACLLALIALGFLFVCADRDGDWTEFLIGGDDESPVWTDAYLDTEQRVPSADRRKTAVLRRRVRRSGEFYLPHRAELRIESSPPHSAHPPDLLSQFRHQHEEERLARDHFSSVTFIAWHPDSTTFLLRHTAGCSNDKYYDHKVLEMGVDGNTHADVHREFQSLLSEDVLRTIAFDDCSGELIYALDGYDGRGRVIISAKVGANRKYAHRRRWYLDTRRRVIETGPLEATAPPGIGSRTRRRLAAQ